MQSYPLFVINKPKYGFTFIKNKQMQPQVEDLPKEKTVTCVSAKVLDS